MATITVGSFSMSDAGTVEGPAAYMASPTGFAQIKARLESGESAVANFASGGASASILVAVQTHYAGWRGMEQIRALSSRSTKTHRGALGVAHPGSRARCASCGGR